MKPSLFRTAGLASIAVALAFACSPATPTPEVAKPIPTLGGEGGVAGPGFATPAKWALGAPSTRWRPTTSLDLDANTKLHAGEGGERWLETDTGIEGASSLAPERILGIQKAEGGYRFVGASGTVYVAHEALGPLSRAGNPVEGTRQVAVGKTAILVVDGKGDLQRSTDGGRTWSKVDLPNKEGVVVDVAMLGDSGILVVAPQRFYGSKDDGVTWSPVKSPGIGVASVVARDGALWLDGVEDSMRFDPAWGTFSTAAAGGRTGTVRRTFGAKPSKFTPSVTRRIDGRRAVEVTGNPVDRTWNLAAGDVGSLGKPKHMEELDGCELVSAALRADRILLACDARGTVSAGIDKDAGPPLPRYNSPRKASAPDGGTLGWITRIFRSDDAGRSFHEETTIEGGMAQRSDESIVAGPDDFIYVGRRCGSGYNAPCLPARVRATKSAGFSEVPGDEDSGQLRFATSATQSTAYSIGQRDTEVFLFKWKSGSGAPEPVGRIAENVDPLSATITVDDDGSVRGFVRESSNPMVFSYREGGSITTTKLTIPATHAAFAGIHGLAFGNDQKGYESVDGGKTWGTVAVPAFVQSIEGCSSFGCVTDRGLRWGWDAPPATPATAATATKAQYQKPLRCSAKDRWVDVGGGNLPTIASVDHGASRWLLPTRDKDGKIALVSSKRGDPTTKTTSVAMMGVPPGPPKFGSGTTTHVQPDGVVVLRYSYARDRKGPGRYNPVDAQIAWYRDSPGNVIGKVFHASVNKNPPFRVNKDPQAGYDRENVPFKELPEVISLGARGVYFHPPSYEEYDDSGNEPKRIPLMLLRDDGKTDKISMPEGLEGGGAATVAQLEGTAAILAQNPENWLAAMLSDGHKIYWSVLGGEGEQDGVVDLVNLGGKPGFAATMRDPARAWAIALKPEGELGAVTPIATQRSLGEVPKPCDGAPSTDPTAYRVDAPYVIGSRRPVVVDSDGAAIVLATDRAEIRGTIGKPEACLAAFDAQLPSQDDDKDYSALIFADDLAHSLLFRADGSAWPATISVRTMECQYQAGPLPEQLEQVEGFVPDTRHAAVVHKRY